MMSNLLAEDLEVVKERLISTRPCFGFVENSDSSWHCIGCVIKRECRESSRRKENGQAE